MNELAKLPVGYQGVLDFVSERAGLVFPPSRLESVRGAIERGLARAGTADLGRYCDLLRSEARAFDDLVAELTIGETYFLREPAHFEFVRQTVLPELRRSGDERPIRVWSAGCATGEEAYSLAIILAEAGLAARSHILATDISRASLAKASEGVYREWSLRGSAVDTARRWLRGQGDRYVLPEDLRQQVVFAYLNLALDVYPSLANGTWGMDLIFCRNVFIYFDAETVRRVAQRLFDSLAPGGWLIAASSDPPLGGLAPLEVVASDQGLFYRRPAESNPRPDAPCLWVVNEEAWPSRDTDGSVVSEGSATLSDPGALAAQPVAPASLKNEPAACVREIHALAKLDPATAQRRCVEALSYNPLSVELHYLHAVLLEGLNRSAEAAAAAGRAIYLDRSLAVAHFTLGVALQRQKDWAGARRAYRNAQQLCEARPAGEVVPLSEGEHAGRLAEAAAAHLTILDAAEQGDEP